MEILFVRRGEQKDWNVKLEIAPDCFVSRNDKTKSDILSYNKPTILTKTDNLNPFSHWHNDCFLSTRVIKLNFHKN